MLNGKYNIIALFCMHMNNTLSPIHKDLFIYFVVNIQKVSLHVDMHGRCQDEAEMHLIFAEYRISNTYEVLFSF